jgi:hypothetical protein
VRHDTWRVAEVFRISRELFARPGKFRELKKENSTYISRISRTKKRKKSNYFLVAENYETDRKEIRTGAGK